MYRIIVKNRTRHAITIGQAVRIEAGMGSAVAASDDIVIADRLVTIAGVGVLLDFPEVLREQFVVATTEFGCVLDHPELGRIEVTIFDPHACSLVILAAAAGSKN